MKNVTEIYRNEPLLLSAFQQGLRHNLSWFLSSHRKTRSLRGFILKQVLLKTVLGIFKIALRLRDRILEIFNVSSVLILKQLFLKNANPFHKTGVPFFNWKKYGWKRIILYKTARSEARGNRIGSTKWIYYKERSFASNYFIFWKILFRFMNLV